MTRVISFFCKHCDELPSDHGPNNKCLFVSTTYEAGGMCREPILFPGEPEDENTQYVRLQIKRPEDE